MTTTIRSLENRLLNWNGTVHYASNGQVSCGNISTHKGWLQPTTATVTCSRCIAMFGEDEPGHVHEIPVDTTSPRAIREAERAARQAARRAS